MLYVAPLVKMHSRLSGLSVPCVVHHKALGNNWYDYLTVSHITFCTLYVPVFNGSLRDLQHRAFFENVCCTFIRCLITIKVRYPSQK